MLNWKDLLVKYVKYSLIGFVGFCISSVIFFIVGLMNYPLAWFVANTIGGLIPFLVFHFKIQIFKSVSA